MTRETPPGAFDEPSRRYVVDGFSKIADCLSIGNIKSSRSLGVASGKFTVRQHRSFVSAEPRLTIICPQVGHGRLMYSAEGHEMEGNIRSGMILLAPAGLSHGFDVQGQATNTILNLDQNLINRVLISDRSVEVLGKIEPSMSMFSATLERLMHEQYRVFQSEAAGWRILTESIALRVIYELLQYFSGKRHGDSFTPLSRREVEMVIDYIEDNLEDNIGLTELADLIDVDVFFLTRAFRRAIGQTPYQFVIHRRLMRVQRLLADTHMSIAEISLAAGFSSQAHMTSAFSKHIGISPGEWRKAVKS